MSNSPATLFSTLRGKARTGILIEGLGLGLAVLVGFMIVSFALDRTLRLETVYRACLLALGAFGVWHALRRSVFRPIRFQLTDDELALAVERGENLNQSLISAVQFERVMQKGVVGQESAELMRHVVDDVYGRVAGIRNAVALDVGRVRRYATIAFGCLVVIGTWAALDHGSLLLWAKRNLFMSSEDWPRKTALRFAMDEDASTVRVPEGNDLTVEVVASGLIPDQVFVEYEFPDGTRGREPMALSGGADAPGGDKRFTWLMESVISSATLHAVGGDAARQSLDIEVVKRPVLEDLTITRTFPAYMKMDPAPVNASEGDVRLPAGVQLDFVGTSTKALQNAYLMFGQERKIPLAIDPGTSTFRGTLVPEKSGILTVDVTDRDGLGAYKPPKIFLRVVPDTAPIVDYKTMGIGSMILYKALIPGTLRIRDDFGITKVVSKIRISGGMADEEKAGSGTGTEPGTGKGTGKGNGDAKEIPWEVVPFEDMRQPTAGENEVDYTEKVVFDLLSRNDVNLASNDPKNPIRPGMLLSIVFESADNFGPGEAHVGTSEVLTLRVVEQDKLLQDLHRRQVERRRELEQILDKEKIHKGEIEEIVAPNSADPRAKLALLRLRAIAREQLALQKQIIGAAQRYELILDEFFNNRIFNPNQILKQRQDIQLPLEKLAQEDFPTSAQEVEDFALGGSPDQRSVAVSSYDAIIKILATVISNMRQLESVAGILEDVRRVRDLERRVEAESKKALDQEDAGAKKVVRPPGPGGDAGTGKDPGTGKDRKDRKDGEDRKDGGEK